MRRSTRPAAADPNAWRTAFLAELRRSGNVAHSARVAEVDRDTPYRHRERDAAFAEAWEETLKASAPRQRDRAEEELEDRVYAGVPEPVIYQGAPCFTAATKDGEWCPDDDPRAVRDGDGNLLKIPMVLYRKDFAALAMKLKATAPDKYRDRVQVSHDNSPAAPRTPAERASAAAEILAELREQLGPEPREPGQG